MASSLPELSLEDLAKDEEFFKGLRNGDFVLVLGAGFSYRIKNKGTGLTEIPFGSDFYDYTNKKFGTNVNTYTSAGSAWEAEIEGNAGLLREFIDLFTVDEAQLEYQLYSAVFLPSWYNIFTFNFDNVLETIRSRARENKYPVRSYPADPSDDDEPNIIHLHGRLIEHSNIADIILTSSQYTALGRQTHDLYDVLHGDIETRRKNLIIIGTQFNEQAVFDKFFHGITGKVAIYHFDFGNENVRVKKEFRDQDYRFVSIKEEYEGETGTRAFLKFLQNNRDKIKNIELPGTDTINRTFEERINSGEKFSRSKFYSAKQTDDCQWYGILNGYDIPRNDYPAIKKVVVNSFSSLSTYKVAAVIHGTGGCGKSTLLRRLALEASRETELEVIWVNNGQLGTFVEDALPKIQTDFENKYLVFIEDWYRLAGQSKEDADNFLKSSQSISNIRIVIGDRDTHGKEYKYNLIDRENMFELKSDENLEIIQKILEKHNDWQTAGNDILKKADVFNSSLFIILFVLAGMAEGRMEDSDIEFLDIEEASQNIARSDLKKIAARYPGLAMALHYWACVYTTHKIHISWNTFLMIADHFNGNNDVSGNFADWKKNDNKIIEKARLYINVSPSLNQAKYQDLDLIQFNHDKLAETVLSQVELENWHNYDRALKRELLKLIVDKGDDVSASVFLSMLLKADPGLFNDNEEKIACVHKLFYGNNNRNVVYLNALGWVTMPAATVLDYLEKALDDKAYAIGLWAKYFQLASLEEKQKVATRVLSLDEFYKLPKEIISTAMNLDGNTTAKTKAVANLLALPEFYLLSHQIVVTAMKKATHTARQAAADKILSQPEFYKLQSEIVTTAMNTQSKWITKAASAILSQKEFYKLPYQMVTMAMKKSNSVIEKAEAASKILIQDDFYTLPAEIVAIAITIASEKDKTGAATAILSQPHFYTLPYPIVTTALTVADKAERAAKVTEILEQDEFYLLQKDIVTAALNLSIDEDERARAVTKILSNDDVHKLPNEIVRAAFKISVDDDEKAAAATAILSQPDIYKVSSDTIAIAMKISKDKAEKGKAADVILSQEEFYKLPAPTVAVALQASLNDELRFSRAGHYLRKWRSEKPRLLFAALSCFSNVEKPPSYIVDIVDAIVYANNYFAKQEKGDNARYIGLLRVPLHNIRTWKEAAKEELKIWRSRKANLMVNVLSSYRAFPDDIEEVCTAILYDWEKEIVKEIRQPFGQPSHFGDHIRIAMGHPALEKLALKTANEMVEMAGKRPDMIPEYLLETAIEIQKGNYPVWQLT